MDNKIGDALAIAIFGLCASKSEWAAREFLSELPFKEYDFIVDGNSFEDDAAEAVRSCTEKANDEADYERRDIEKEYEIVVYADGSEIGKFYWTVPAEYTQHYSETERTY